MNTNTTHTTDTHYGTCRRCGAQVTGIPRRVDAGRGFYVVLRVTPTDTAGDGPGWPCEHQDPSRARVGEDGRVTVQTDSAPKRIA